MFQFLQPIWLTGLAGITIPVIIHLWNQRPGKTLKVGSISLVAENAQRYQNRLQLAEILLLILRCLLIAFVAFALSGLQWRSAIIESSKGWVLLPRKELSNTYQHFRSTVDSLLSAGYEFHFFEEGFEKDKLQHALAGSAEKRSGEISNRSIINALDKQVDDSFPVYVFTDQYLRNFSGTRTAVALNLHWQMYAVDSPPAPAAVDTTTMQVTIFSQQHTNDTRYLQAALESIRESANKRLNIKLATNPHDIPDQQDWVFWLEETPVPADRYSTNVLSYAAGNPQQLASVILPGDGSLFAAVEVNKLIIKKDSIDQIDDVRWCDGFGHPVLTARQQGGQMQYKLYTHIDPSWNELPWSDNFPLILYGLLYADYATNNLADVKDKRLIDPAQAMPAILSSKQYNARPIRERITPLAGICWLVAFVLFFLERCLSFYHSKLKANG